MAQESNGIVSQQDLAELAELEKHLLSVNAQLDATVTKLNNVDKNLSRTTSEFNKVNKAVEELAVVEKEANVALEKQAQVIQEVEKVQQRVMKTDLEINKQRKEEINLINISREAYERVGDGLTSLIKRQTEIQRELKSVQNEIKNANKLYEAGRTSIDEYTKNVSRLRSAELDLQATNTRLNREIKNNQTIISTSIGSYNNLSAQYSQLKILINDLTDGERANGYTKEELIEQSRLLREEMNRYQLSTGNASLQVGQYDKFSQQLLTTLDMTNPAVGNLVRSCTQLNATFTTLASNPLIAVLGVFAGTAGALYSILSQTISVIESNERQYARLQQTISPLTAAQNNLTRAFESFGDSLLDIGDKITSFIFNLSPVESFFTQLGGNLLNFVPVVGRVSSAVQSLFNITLGTANIKEEAEAIAQLAQDRYNYTVNTRRLNESIVREESEIAELRAQAADRANLSAQERTDLFNEIDRRETELYQQRLANAKENLRLLTEEAKFTENDAAAEDRLSQARIELDRVTIQYQNTLRTLNRERAFATTQLNREESEQAKALTREIRAQVEILQLRRNIEAEENRIVLNDSKNGYYERLNAAENYYAQLEALIIDAREEQLKDTSLTATQRILVEEKANFEIVKLQRERNKTILDLDAKFRKDLQSQIEKSNTSELNNLRQEQLDEELALSEKYAAGEIKRKRDYEIEKFNIQQYYAMERYNIELRTLQNVAKLYVDDAAKYEKIQNQILAIQTRIQDQQTAIVIRENVKRRKEAERQAQQLQQALNRLYQQLNATVFGLIDSSLERQIQALGQQMDELSKYYEQKNELIQEQEEAGLISAEYADQMRNYYAMQEAERQAELEEQKKQIQRRQDKYEKASGLLSIAINTAVGIMKAFADLGPIAGIPLAAVIGATGAAQAAVVAARPLPQYAEGTQDHKGGLAIVGDGGRSELIRTPDGGLFKTPSVPTLLDLPKHAQVFPDFNKEMRGIHDQNMSVLLNDGKQVHLLGKNYHAMRESANYQKEILYYQKLNSTILQRQTVTNKLNSLKKN